MPIFFIRQFYLWFSSERGDMKTCIYVPTLLKIVSESCFYKPSVHESAYSCTDGQSMVRHYERDDAMGYQAAKQV